MALTLTALSLFICQVLTAMELGYNLRFYLAVRIGAAVSVAREKSCSGVIEV